MIHRKVSPIFLALVLGSLVSKPPVIVNRVLITLHFVMIALHLALKKWLSSDLDNIVPLVLILIA